MIKDNSPVDVICFVTDVSLAVLVYQWCIDSPHLGIIDASILGVMVSLMHRAIDAS